MGLHRPGDSARIGFICFFGTVSAFGRFLIGSFGSIGTVTHLLMQELEMQ